MRSFLGDEASNEGAEKVSEAASEPFAGKAVDEEVDRAVERDLVTFLLLQIYCRLCFFPNNIAYTGKCRKMAVRGFYAMLRLLTHTKVLIFGAF